MARFSIMIAWGVGDEGRVEGGESLLSVCVFASGRVSG